MCEWGLDIENQASIYSQTHKQFSVGHQCMFELWAMNGLHLQSLKIVCHSLIHTLLLCRWGANPIGNNSGISVLPKTGSRIWTDNPSIIGQPTHCHPKARKPGEKPHRYTENMQPPHRKVCNIQFYRALMQWPLFFFTSSIWDYWKLATRILGRKMESFDLVFWSVAHQFVLRFYGEW